MKILKAIMLKYFGSFKERPKGKKCVTISTENTIIYQVSSDEDIQGDYAKVFWISIEKTEKEKNCDIIPTVNTFINQDYSDEYIQGEYTEVFLIILERTEMTNILCYFFNRKYNYLSS